MYSYNFERGIFLGMSIKDNTTKVLNFTLSRLFTEAQLADYKQPTSIREVLYTWYSLANKRYPAKDGLPWESRVKYWTKPDVCFLVFEYTDFVDVDSELRIKLSGKPDKLNNSIPLFNSYIRKVLGRPDTFLRELHVLCNRINLEMDNKFVVKADKFVVDNGFGADSKLKPPSSHVYYGNTSNTVIIDELKEEEKSMSKVSQVLQMNKSEIKNTVPGLLKGNAANSAVKAALRPLIAKVFKQAADSKAGMLERYVANRKVEAMVEVFMDSPMFDLLAAQVVSLVSTFDVPGVDQNLAEMSQEAAWSKLALSLDLESIFGGLIENLKAVGTKVSEAKE